MKTRDRFGGGSAGRISCEAWQAFCRHTLKFCRAKKWAGLQHRSGSNASGKKLVPRVSGAAVKVFEGTIQI